jgi:predicted RNA-binding protein with PUA-like domain
MATFLLKTEPGAYAFNDLVRDGRTVWNGVTNNAVLGFIRQARRGDAALIYHTGDERAIVGLAEIASDPYEDPAKPGQTKDGRPKFVVFDLKAGPAARTPVTLDAIKADPRFKEFELVRLPRLSVMPVPTRLDVMLRKMAGLPPS